MPNSIWRAVPKLNKLGPWVARKRLSLLTEFVYPLIVFAVPRRAVDGRVKGSMLKFARLNRLKAEADGSSVNLSPSLMGAEIFKSTDFNHPRFARFFSG